MPRNGGNYEISRRTTILLLIILNNIILKIKELYYSLPFPSSFSGFFSFWGSVGIKPAICSICVWAPREQIPRYQVIVSDEVNFNNFNDYYKIIKQEGLIYTVEKRES